MKREEAIQVLQTALTSPFIYGEYADSINMAIEALQFADKSPRTVKLTEDIVVTLDEEAYEIGYTHGQMADRPKGEWVFHVNFSDESQRDDYDLICTNCGELYRCDCQDDVNDFAWNAHYCMNCGAYMGAKLRELYGAYKGGDTQ